MSPFSISLFDGSVCPPGDEFDVTCPTVRAKLKVRVRFI